MSRLSIADTVRVGGAGLRSRPLRIALSALGIAIGVAAMVAVVAISASSKAAVTRDLDALGTNLLITQPGDKLDGTKAKLRPEASSMVARIPSVQSVSATGRLDEKVYRNEHIPVGESGSLQVQAARPDLLGTVGARLARGRWLDNAPDGPVLVLGSLAADRLGIDRPGPSVWSAGRWFTVVGILHPVPLAPELDASALTGWETAKRLLDFDGSPTTIYTRSEKRDVEKVRALLAATINPEAPLEVRVSRPSDALAAARRTDEAFSGLLLGLAAVALLVGGVGIANTMVISVLERRREIGLRRALGATRGQIRTQFLAESLLLAALGGTGGMLTGAMVTGGYAWYRGWPPVLPLWTVAGGLAATVVVGAVAGWYPAARAATMPPTEALAT
ncbi:ABC transporter permease [Actinoplanes xinjiangensis]|uniref:Putative ABC transport system permease protein n=1 Tax=Actinoplanes xinjiangensis TaxID=512350 RepID=A0A316FBN7_9ACTN|nr:ABC transporter permease [Actinoplanes xinjiangensis]PWK46288.1 putative ABC transport system permease protein [Actinoplanes xinjiangensis]GIF40774.1 ABC transporter permease [Actinoplanes xinjiangensis]